MNEDARAIEQIEMINQRLIDIEFNRLDLDFLDEDVPMYE